MSAIHVKLWHQDLSRLVLVLGGLYRCFEHIHLIEFSLVRSFLSLATFLKDDRVKGVDIRL